MSQTANIPDYSQSVPPGFDLVEEFWGEEDLWRACESASSGGFGLVEEFESRFRGKFLPGSIVAMTDSGRGALRYALEHSRQPKREFVLTPAYCCKIVGEAIVAAGLRPYWVDSGATPGSIDLNQCEDAIVSGKVSAVVVPYLFGMPLDIRPILPVARKHGVAVIEDCANCLGGMIGDAPAGSLGDFAIFSFNYGKPIFLGGGGVLVQNRESSGRPSLSSRFAGLLANTLEPGAEKQDLEAYLARIREHRATLFHPAIPRLITARRLARRIFGGGYWYARWLGDKLLRRRDPADLFDPPRSTGPVRAALGLDLLDKYDGVLRQRNQNHALLAGYLHEGTGAELIRPESCVSPAWLSARISLPGPAATDIDTMMRQLCLQGFCAGRVYAHTMDQFGELRWKSKGLNNLSHARRHSEGSIELPIHQNLSASDIGRMATALISLISEIGSKRH